ncbi:MAG: AAA family ATPase [Candidatus Aenigmatarchaeota archaeon]
MLLEKYEPKSLKDFIGNQKQVTEIIHWLKSSKGTLMLHGPTGTGKSLCVRLAAKELGYHISELDANEYRNYESIKKFADNSMQKSLLGKRLLLIDECEFLDTTRGIEELVKTSRHPLVFITSNPYEKKLYSLRRLCRLIKFEKPDVRSIATFLRAVCAKEKILCETTALMDFSRNCNGDIRAALMDLEAMDKLTLESIKNISSREHENDIFNTMRAIFKSPHIKDALEAMAKSEKPIEEIFMWLAENIPNEYSSSEEISFAYDSLAKADMYMSRIIKRQSWSLYKYFSEISVCGTAAAKNRQHMGFTRYTMPRYLQKPDLPLQKIAIGLRISEKRAKEYLILMKFLMKGRNKEDIKKLFAFDSDDVEAIESV